MQASRLIASGVLVLLGFGILLYFQNSEPKSEPIKEIAKPVPQLANNPPTTPTPVEEPMTDKEVRALEVFLSDENFLQVEETLIIDGIPLIRVLGDKVTKDPVTGVLTITGVTKLLLLDGSYVEMSPDGYVTHDPATGKTHAEAAHTQFVPVKKPDEK